MIYFVLQNARVPSVRFNPVQSLMLIPTLYGHRPRSLYESTEAGNAQTSFEKLDLLFRSGHDARVYQNVEGQWPAIPLGEAFRRYIFQVFWPVFDHRKLNWEADLRSGQTHPGSVSHRLAHPFD
jgi:hypothetical protein